jgi:hypothetical protein
MGMHPEIVGRQATLRRNLENLVIEMSNLAREHLGDGYRNRDAALGWLERADIVSRVVDSIPVSGGEPIGRSPWWLQRRPDLTQEPSTTPAPAT